jgi:small conductance mechanosensitive channel
MKIEKFYSQGNDWTIRYGPRFVVGILVLFVGLWLIRLVLNWSHKGMHRKEMDPTLKPGFEDTKLILKEAILQDLKDAGTKIGGL